MLEYILRRALYAIVLLLAVSIVSFAIIQLPPGDYLTTVRQNLRSAGAQEEQIRETLVALEQRYGMGRPMYVQYFRWFGGFLHGDLGQSFQWGLPVSTLIRERLALTVIVSFVTLIFTWLVAFPIGIYSATHQYSKGDYFFTFLGFLGLCIPDFLLALVLAYFIFTVTGMSLLGLFSIDYQQAPWSLGKFLDMLKHMAIPIIVVGAAGTASMIRVLRAQLLDELSKPYVVTARAKGLSEWTMLVRYPIRLAVNPMLSTVGYVLPAIFSGTVIVSVVLNLEMIGPLFLRALQFQDMYLAASIVMILGALTILGTLLSDLLLAWSDPRIRLTR